MQRVLEYEQQAAECRKMAAGMNDPQLKKQLENMAELWDRLARERRQGVLESNPNHAQSQTEK